MFWNYNCPECHRPTAVDWRFREGEVVCHTCGQAHYPPTPHEDRYAYVDGSQWPKELEDAVVSLRGTVCAVSGCFHERSTLVHRKSLKAGGRTSVDNLMPMCERHAASKGDRDYDEWLAAIRLEEAGKKPDEPKFEITITSRQPPPVDTFAGFGVPVGLTLPLAAFRAPRPPSAVTSPGPATAELRQAVPFVRGSVNKVVFDYDWEMKQSGRCRVFLLAWPKDAEPDLALLGGPKYPGWFAAKEHLGVKGEKGTAQLELALPGVPAGRWVAAFAVLDEGCALQFTEYCLAATS
jgi:5-methylcytosine-specific restriction endonuclease McrA